MFSELNALPLLLGRLLPEPQLLISTVHRINAHSEEKVITELVKDFKRVTGKETLLRKIAEASLGTPDNTVRRAHAFVLGARPALLAKSSST